MATTTHTSNGHVSDDDIDIDQLVAAAIVHEPRRRLMHADELANLPPVTYLPGLEGELPENVLAALVGGSGAGKSFYALDTYALPIAQHYNVVYIAAEGVSGYAERTRAWCLHTKSTTGGLHFWTEPVNMLDPASVDQFISEITPIAPKIVIADTLARCMLGGDENSAKDMGLFIAACDKVRTALSATVLIVHHTGKNGDYRGSSALKGAVDAMIELRNDDGVIEVSCAKMKDGAPFSPRRYELVPVLNTESCVIVPSARMHRTKDDKLSNAQRKLLEFLSHSIFRDTGARSRDIEQAGIMQRSQVYGALSGLKDKDYLTQGQKGDPYYVTDQGRAALEREYAASPKPHLSHSNAQVHKSTISPKSVQQTLSPQVHVVHHPFRGVDSSGLDKSNGHGGVK